MMALRRPTVPVSALLLVVISLPALADGGFIPVVHGVANSADQRAIIIDRGGAETIVLQTAYDGDASDFAWVVPLPELISGGDAIGTADPRVFDVLHDLTAPRSVGSQYAASAGVCGCAGSEGARVENGVTVWETLRVEDYDVAVLSAAESTDLTAWLAGNGYGLPAGSGDTLQYYVDKQWFFVAFKIAPVDDGGNVGDGGLGPPGAGQSGEELRPITITFPTRQLVFPLRISRVSTRDRVEVLLYIMASHRMDGDNYTTVEVGTPATWLGDDFDRTYDGWFEGTIADAGGKALVVEYAGWVPEYALDGPAFDGLDLPGGARFVTRLRTRLRPAQMDADVMMVAAASDEHFSVVVGDAYGLLRGGAGLGMLLLAGVQGLAFRSPRGRRLSLGSALCAVLIILL